MEKTLNPTANIPTFRKSETKPYQKPEMGRHAVVLHDTAGGSFRRCERPEATHRRARRKRRDSKVQMKVHVSCASEDDEKAEVERKIVALQRIVPGGESLGVDKLFEETAGYILALQCQIKAMRVLASFIEGLEKEKRKLGG